MPRAKKIIESAEAPAEKKPSKKKTSAAKSYDGKSLVIVESPTKAKTISKYLGKDFVVLSSFGHVRDLPKSKMGVDIEHGFAPQYEIPEKALKHVQEIRKAAAKAKMVYFASDEDREGEAISWHLLELLGLEPERVKRITFHEITEEAIKHALENPRALDTHLVDAQQARRVLDRLVGYKLSPFLWSKITFGLSAGRVQSVVVRLIVEREREIQKFVAQEYWSIEAMLTRKNDAAPFVSRLVKKDGETLDKFALSSGTMAEKVIADLVGAAWTVQSIERKTTRRSPMAPFTTSTLQQEGNNRLGYSTKQTMMIAQKLYEGVELGSAGHTGLITYMRTDSVNLSEKFLTESRAWLEKNLGARSLPEESRRYKTKAKGAQEAHEAIRPTDVFRTPESVAAFLDDRQLRLYTLIWQRAVASQMADAELSTLTVNIDATTKGPLYGFRANGSTIMKKGFLEVYDTDTKETFLPELAEKDALKAESVVPKQHFTEPPPRYTEASLVKTLEEDGIGRPSTYAPTISTVVGRGYVEVDARKLKPTDLGFLISDLLVRHFPQIVDYGFTAKIEEDFDAIAEGKEEWVPVIKNFFGPFEKNLEAKTKEVKKEDFYEKTDIVCEKCGRPMIAKYGRLGKFLGCTGYDDPDKTKRCKNTRPMPGTEQADAQATALAEGEVCPACGAPMVAKQSKYGQFLGCSRYPECKTIKAIQKKTGAKCPECKIGDIIEKKTRKGKPFFACSRYPECKHAMWSKPTGENCPKCGKLLVFAKADTVRCEDKECGFEKANDKKIDAEPVA
jgi:DNA topoisomerase-1